MCISNVLRITQASVAGLYNNHRYQTYYCKHNDQTLQLFASSLFFAGAVSSIPGDALNSKPSLCHSLVHLWMAPQELKGLQDFNFQSLAVLCPLVAKV